jgi:Flp pilus assembly protein TadG
MANLRKFCEANGFLAANSDASGRRLTRGQTAVEFAIVSALFFFILLAVIDYGWLMFAEMNIQQAVDDGGRYASTGQESGSGDRITSIISTIQNEISVPNVNVASSISICSSPPGTQGTACSCSSSADLCYNSTTDKGNASAAGGPQSVVTITLTTPLSLLAPLSFFGQFFPSSGYNFTSSATFTNEPFSPSTTS